MYLVKASRPSSTSIPSLSQSTLRVAFQGLFRSSISTSLMPEKQYFRERNQSPGLDTKRALVDYFLEFGEGAVGTEYSRDLTEIENLMVSSCRGLNGVSTDPTLPAHMFVYNSWVPLSLLPGHLKGVTPIWLPEPKADNGAWFYRTTDLAICREEKGVPAFRLYGSGYGTISQLCCSPTRCILEFPLVEWHAGSSAENMPAMPNCNCQPTCGCTEFSWPRRGIKHDDGMWSFV
jgi:hypothetical protein